MKQSEMFDNVAGIVTPKGILGMVHRADPDTSRVAADRILECRSELHREVLAALTIEQLTDEELENLPQFDHYGPSTIRKRRSELYQADKIEPNGERLNERGFKMIIWRIK